MNTLPKRLYVYHMCAWYLMISKKSVGPKRPAVMDVGKFSYGGGEKAQWFKDSVF